MIHFTLTPKVNNIQLILIIGSPILLTFRPGFKKGGTPTLRTGSCLTACYLIEAFSVERRNHA
jgi:hypothetical protein